MTKLILAAGIALASVIAAQAGGFNSFAVPNLGPPPMQFNFSGGGSFAPAPQPRAPNIEGHPDGGGGMIFFDHNTQRSMHCRRSYGGGVQCN